MDHDLSELPPKHADVDASATALKMSGIVAMMLMTMVMRMATDWQLLTACQGPGRQREERHLFPNLINLISSRGFA